MMRRVIALMLGLSVFSLLPAQTTAAPPVGFVTEIVAGLDELDQPTAFAFLPNGALLVATKPGRLLLYRDGALRPQPVFDRVSGICSNSERGLLGVAVDPLFETNRFVYVYYTWNKFNTQPPSACSTNKPDDPVNRVSRLTLSTNFTTASELVLVDNIPSPNGNHNAGDLHFGKDGYLYIATGDGGRNNTARERHNLDGAILRITRDGAIPPGNPYQGAGTARCNTASTTPGTLCQEIFAFGLRNPFRIAFDSNAPTTRFFINDVGQGAVEEISAGQAGGDYGWNCFEGTRVNRSDGACAGVAFADTVPPVFEYVRGSNKPSTQPAFFDGCASITGGAFVPAGVWPSSFDGAFVFGDYVCRRLFTLFADNTPALFESNAGAPTHIAFGPFEQTQALYYADIAAGDIVRIRYTGNANRSPTARFNATPTFGNPPLTVAFDASASTDPDSADAIVAYVWNFGDGSAPRETTTPTTNYTYTDAGPATASLRVRDSRGTLSGNPATLRIDVGNAAPSARILAPPAGTRFGVDELFTLRGEASDPEDGVLAGTQLKWEVRRHHDAHFHPWLSATGAEVTLRAPAPEDLAAVNTSYLEVILTAVDSNGRSSAPVALELQPRIVALSFATEPPGLAVQLDDGVAVTTLPTPATVNSWPGWQLGLAAPAGQSAGGQPARLCGWRHGGSPAQTYTTPAVDRQLTAVFAPADAACPAGLGPEFLFLPQLGR